MRVTKNLNGIAGKFFLQVIDYDIVEELQRNKLIIRYSIVCNKELAEITNIKGKCTAIMRINKEVVEIYNGDIIFEDGYTLLLQHEEIFTTEDAKKLNIQVEWFMTEEYEGIERSSITTNILVPGLISKIPVLIAYLDYESGSNRFFVTTNVDRNVDFFEYKLNSGNWTRTAKDFYVDADSDVKRNFLQVRAKQLSGTEFGYSNVLKF